ncbi:MAG: helix-turn-helix domain-containing protein [Armatimonadota bacterium]
MEWLSERLRQLLEERGLTVQGLSDRTGLSRSYLSLIMHRRRQPPEDTVRRLATFFNQDPDEWVFHTLKEPQVEKIRDEFPKHFEAVYTRRAAGGHGN